MPMPFKIVDLIPLAKSCLISLEVEEFFSGAFFLPY
jgi:hypothetical protein